MWRCLEMKEMQFPQKKKSRKTNERRADKNAAGQRAQPEPERPVVHAPQKDEDFEAIPLPPPFCSVKKIVFAASGEGGGASSSRACTSPSPAHFTAHRSVPFFQLPSAHF